MNILFLTLLDFESIYEHNIYTDLLRKFHKEGHNVYAISPVERKKKVDTRYIQEERIRILKLKIGNIQKTNIIEKGISTITLERTFIAGIKKYFADVKFDLVLYSTPPITLQKAVQYVKKRDNAVTYLMLKDIFPQNAVDMGMLSKTGVKSILYKYFRSKEKKLYANSDYIGCMSQANVDYVLKHNVEVNPERVEICPNCIDVSEKQGALCEEESRAIKKKYGIPENKKVFIYGGNLGKPQGVDFIIECVKAVEQLENIYVLIVGSGTEYQKLEKAICDNQLKNTKLYSFLPKAEYDCLLKVCDIGLIFLDYRFTIPNFPSRLLAYMDAGKPVLAVVDSSTDVGMVIEQGGFGWSCESGKLDEVMRILSEIQECDVIRKYGENAREYLLNNYTVCKGYNTIMTHLDE